MDGLLEMLLVGSSVVIALIGLVLIPIGLPGNWLIALAGLVSPLWLGGNWLPVSVLFGAALLVEIADTVMAARFAKARGAGKSGMFGAFIGGFVGALSLTFLIPIPVIGTLFGAAAGAFLGAVAFEMIFAGRKWSELSGAGWGAFLGSLAGKGLKLAVGVFQVVWLSMTLFG